uniref:Uncharacterized protein n=1 Tax=Timema genevievae TaxID=629358 RepID=A0A7R9PNY7_TIMGE|nr:unnamed protein product [Timema genevievae]
MKGLPSDTVSPPDSVLGGGHSSRSMDLFAVSLAVPLMSAHLKSLGASHFMIGALGSLYPALQLISGPIVLSRLGDLLLLSRRPCAKDARRLALGCHVL